uniref:SET domain-containing protein n=1 Tax=Rhodosorus marinus TaxID=101924 RepID=A0A7S2ZGI1_9RHOD|mmetsp:Transcript_1756/g.6562  ORF Transcript_1756/g.6562 Transcript_1756/m.6562 type:complete len:472 (+) Transcript_1756:405-1820(+)
MELGFVSPAGLAGQRRGGRAIRMSDGPPVSPFASKGKGGASLEKSLVEIEREKNKTLQDWLGDNGVYMSDRSGWGKAPHGLVISNETTDEGEPCGRGLLAKRDITQGEPIFEIPVELCLTKAKAVEMLDLPEDLNEYISIAILLISERNKGSGSFFKPYIDILPSDEGLNPMFRWPAEDRELLRGSPVIAAAKSLEEKLTTEYNEINESLFKKRRKEFPEEIYNCESWEWAFAVLFSRAVLLDPLSYEDQELALVPYADLLNHNPFCSAFIERQKRMFSKNKFVVVYADRNYNKMEQIYTTYGQKANSEFAILYGFVVDRNPYDSIDVTVGLSSDDPLYDVKVDYLKRIGKEESIAFPIYADRSPVEMIEFLRFCVADEEELGIGVFNRMVTVKNELSVANMLVACCEEALAAYSTSLEDDNALMSDRKMYTMLGKNARMAIKLRRAEKKILTRTIADIERRRTKPKDLFS